MPTDKPNTGVGPSFSMNTMPKRRPGANMNNPVSNMSSPVSGMGTGSGPTMGGPPGSDIFMNRTGVMGPNPGMGGIGRMPLPTDPNRLKPPSLGNNLPNQIDGPSRSFNRMPGKGPAPYSGGYGGMVQGFGPSPDAFQQIMQMLAQMYGQR